jgi:large subunit ribosomal protein L13
MSSFTAGTYSAKHGDIKKAWYVIDAEKMVLGRLASRVALILRGKHKAKFTPHMDSGDNVIIINAEKVELTGNKKENSIFYWHTGHPGGIKERTQKAIFSGKYPERVLKKAIERMMPKDSPLARKQMKSLHVYAGQAHPHEAQQPQVLDLGASNIKNKRK